jgi:hypothetical protein
MCLLYSHVEALHVITIDFIFRLLHISNLHSLVVLTPPCTPYTPFADYAHLSTNYVNSSSNCENTYINCIDISTDYGSKFYDRANTTVDLANTFNISSLDLWIPNPSLCQLFFTNLLFIYR